MHENAVQNFSWDVHLVSNMHLNLLVGEGRQKDDAEEIESINYGRRIAVVLKSGFGANPAVVLVKDEWATSQIDLR